MYSKFLNSISKHLDIYYKMLDDSLEYGIAEYIAYHMPEEYKRIKFHDIIHKEVENTYFRLTIYPGPYGKSERVRVVTLQATDIDLKDMKLICNCIEKNFHGLPDMYTTNAEFRFDKEGFRNIMGGEVRFRKIYESDWIKELERMINVGVKFTYKIEKIKAVEKPHKP